MKLSCPVANQNTFIRVANQNTFLRLSDLEEVVIFGSLAVHNTDPDPLKNR